MNLKNGLRLAAAPHPHWDRMWWRRWCDDNGWNGNIVTKVFNNVRVWWIIITAAARTIITAKRRYIIFAVGIILIAVTFANTKRITTKIMIVCLIVISIGRRPSDANCTAGVKVPMGRSSASNSYNAIDHASLRHSMSNPSQNAKTRPDA